MASPDFAVQTVLYTQVTAAVTPIVVYDGLAPDGVAYPFVTIGGDVVEEAGTKTTDGWSFASDISIWSQQRAYKECKDNAELIRLALHDQIFTQDGHRLYMVRESTRRYFEEEDGHGRRCVMEFIIRVEPT